ncbi:hypothetical protein [Virgibacillus halodenitrificans]|uniref:hypothetical protein n=1 Tax=Virgibacillus halodenitrificans TaxID=1482 RepID=UPI000EF47578|nr:hypothetical protein [Virgibacillus halodenitrificans]
MEEERIKKTFLLVEPFLPEKVVSDFEHFIDESIEIRQMYHYNSQLNEMLRDSIRTLREKLKEAEQKLRNSEEKNFN